MKSAKDLVDTLRNILGNEVAVMPAVVVSVDKDLNVCEVQVNGLEFGEVRLQATVKQNAKGFKVFPAEGSVVMIERLGKLGDFFVTMTSEVDEIVADLDNTRFSLKDGIELKRGNETLKAIISDLLDEIGQIVVPTNVGPSGIPINKPAFDAIKLRVAQLLK